MKLKKAKNMKTIKSIFRILFTALLLISFAGNTTAQERKETFEKSYKHSSSGDFTFTCYDTDLKVNTWQKDEVKIMGEIIISGGDKEDQDELVKVFNNPKVSQLGNSLNIETDMAKNTVMIGFGPKMTVTLVNGKKVKIDKYKVTYTLWIPENVTFNLNSKYNDIEVAALTGKANFTLYDADLTMLSFGNDSRFEMKYSSASIGKGGDAVMNIYDCELEAIEMNKVEIESKYSEIEIGTLNTLDFNSYDDDIKIGKINSLKTEAKYSDFKIRSNMENCIIDFYDSDIDAMNMDKLVFNAKYSSLEAGDVKVVNIRSLFDSDIRLGTVGEFICDESKYDDIRISAIGKQINLPLVYDTDLNFGKALPGFESLTGDFKYSTLHIIIDPAIEFSIKLDATYGSVDFPKDRIKVREMNITENGKKYFEGQTKENPACKIDVKSYDSVISLN